MAASSAGGGLNAADITFPSGAVLVLNAGSSSLKAALIASDESVLWREQWTSDATASGVTAQSPEAVLEDGLAPLLSRRGGEPSLVGHRVVHGGRRFTAPARLDAQVLGELEQLVPLAPLHNPPALRVMHWLMARLPGLPQWACFDTAFHHTLPAQAYTYALPAAWRELGLRRYGFHGLNHQHVSEVVQRLEGSGPEGALRLISCHLGAGCSLCAIRGGVSIATTMGFTPMEGLVMASRCGSVDPGVLLDLLRRGVSAADLEQQLQTQSGLLGLSGLSGSMRDLRVAASEGHAGAQLAIAVFEERLRQGIGAMAASLGGVDVIALSGGIGENDLQLQDDLRRDLAWLGPFRLHVVPADEEGVIARACRAAERNHRQDGATGERPPQAAAGSAELASTAAQAIGLANQ
jgi:acetate kinase